MVAAIIKVYTIKTMINSHMYMYVLYHFWCVIIIYQVYQSFPATVNISSDIYNTLMPQLSSILYKKN